MLSVQFRPLVPVAYNPRREFEQPIPRAEFTIDAIGDAAVEGNDHDLESTFFDSAELNHPTDLENAAEMNNSIELNNSTQIEMKPEIHVDGEDLIAFEIMFRNNNNAEMIVNEVDPLATSENENANSNNYAETIANEVDPLFFEGFVFKIKYKNGIQFKTNASRNKKKIDTIRPSC